MSMFAKPRLKKSLLPAPSKKRKSKYGVEELAFDNDARQEYLTGFHKRKQQRIKQSQEEAAKKARQEKLDTRKQLREERRREVEQHVENVNRLLWESGAIDDLDQKSDNEVHKGWDGFLDQPEMKIVEQEEEYIDEDRYTTVTIESVSVSRDGLGKPTPLQGEIKDNPNTSEDNDDQEISSKPSGLARLKKKNQKSRYKSKLNRQ